jgi:DNA-binding response OmpR family regulator
MPTVLIVEDNPLILKSIEHFLNKEGFDVASASDGKEACDYLDRIQFDVVVTDLMMPHAGGIEVLKHLKKNPANEHVGIIIVSSISKEHTIMESMGLGADDFLVKPVKPFDLVIRIKKLLEEKKQQSNQPK